AWRRRGQHAPDAAGAIHADTISISIPAHRMDCRLHEFQPFTLMSHRIHLILARKKISFATYFGLQVGDALVEFQQRDASELSTGELRRLASPTIMTFARGTREDVEEVTAIRIQAVWRGHASRERGVQPFFQDFQITASAGPLGLTTELPPLDRLAVQSVQPGGWAETAGVRAGDLLRALNDVSVDELPPEEFVRLVEFVRPLSMAFSRKISRAQVALKQAFTVEANESVGRLGFKPDSLPPVE
ncbi:unnamed protein product, partial [Effrenium voratum]